MRAFISGRSEGLNLFRRLYLSFLRSNAKENSRLNCLGGRVLPCLVSRMMWERIRGEQRTSWSEGRYAGFG